MTFCESHNRFLLSRATFVRCICACPFPGRDFLRERERGGGRKEKDKGVPMVNFLYISIRIENVDSLESRNLKNIEIVVLLKKNLAKLFF